MAEFSREHSAPTWIGLGTTPRNPTVQAEFHRMLLAEAEMMVATLFSDAKSDDQQAIDYLENLPKTLEAFDTSKPDIFGFGSLRASYLVDSSYESNIITKAQQDFGFPIITTSQAILSALNAIGAKKVAIVSPFPNTVIDAAENFYKDHNVTVVARKNMAYDNSDWRNVYRMSGHQTASEIRSMDLNDAEAVLVLGTAVPTLRAIRMNSLTFNIPLLSSNYCLAWALLQAADRATAPWSESGPTLAML